MEDQSPDHISVGSAPKKSSTSSRGRHRNFSSSTCKDFLRKFVDNELLTSSLEDWFSGHSEDCDFRKPAFDVPFDLTELQNFDYALEGVTFQQLVRMPNALYASTSDVFEATAYLALEDFLHAGIKGLWETFWGPDEAMPFSVACIHSTSSKFYPAEKAISSGKLDGVCATAVLLKNLKHSQGRWDHIVVLALLRPDIGMVSTQGDQEPSPAVLGEALFFALRVLLSRSLSRSSTVLRNSDCVYLLLVDSQFGGVVKVQGDLNKLDFDLNNVYDSAAEWIKKHARISVSSIDRVWNKLGNANWGDIGTLQVLIAIFHSMIQFYGEPKYSLNELATEHSSRLQSRRSERHLVDRQANGNGLSRYQQQSHSPEIVEVQEETAVDVKPQEILKLEIGTVVLMDDAYSQKGFQINDILTDSDPPIYSSTPVEEPTKTYLLYVGSSPSHLEPAWEDMNSWYQVQRQTKVLTLMKQRGISSRYIPQMVSSGRAIHPGPCNKPNSSGSCGHPWCSTPILVTSPVGETISNLIRNGLFGVEEALRCCHDCLSALAASASAGIRHGDIRPENVIRVSNGSRHPYFVLTGWGHAILEDRDRPVMNLFFSSTFALQEGKLCAASDAESLIYLLYFSCGGVCPELDSVESALQWRETSWSRRVIQQKLGDVSAVLKAFADYVDSLCGTPYPMDYEIWLKRLRRTINEDHGKERSPVRRLEHARSFASGRPAVAASIPVGGDEGSMAAAAPVYRRVLRAVQKHVGGDSSKQHFRDFIAAEFRAPAGTEADARARLRLAGDYAYLLTSVHHHKDLLFSYNIAVDRSDEMKKILNKSAASMFQHLHFHVPELKENALFFCSRSCSCHLNYPQRNRSLCSEVLLGSAYLQQVLLCFPCLDQSSPLGLSHPAQCMECRIQLQVHPHLRVNGNCSLEEVSW